jgi:hypothetical protein
MTSIGGEANLALIIRKLTVPSSIRAAPPFTGLRNFPEGRGFKQWTGDDSKGLMKVRIHFLLAIVAPKFHYLILLPNRCTYLQSKDTYLSKWSAQFDHFSTSVTLLGAM